MAKSKSEEALTEKERTEEEFVKPEPVVRNYGPKAIQDAAMRAYIAWGANQGYKNERGEDLPTWDQLSQPLQDAWKNAAFAVLTGG